MATFDNHTNLAYSTLGSTSLTIGGPPTGTVVVQTGDGAKFPAPPFNASVWPANVASLPSNTEIVRVTAISTDTLTVATRNAEAGGTQQTIAANYQISAGLTLKTFSDIETPLTKLTNITTISTNTTLGVNDGVALVNAASGAITITLPNAASVATGIAYNIKKIDLSANFVTVVPNGSQTIDGNATLPLKSVYSAAEIISDGTQWWVI